MLRNSGSLCYIILILFLSLCSEVKTSDNTSQLIFPDSKTFFPLLKGSTWFYEEYLEGELQKGNFLIDSVSEVIKTDSTIIVKINRISGSGREKTFFYIIDKDGMVFYKRRKESAKKQFCKLFPRNSDIIGEMSYGDFYDTIKTQIILQTCEYDKASSQEQLEWQGKVFKKGIGIVSFGSASLGYELIKYRIGSDGPLIQYRKD